MRLLYAIILIVLNSALGFCQEAEFSIDKAVYKFPKTKEGTLLEHYFEIQNTGTVPLIISGYKVACTCTKVSLPEKPIMPGEKYSLLVTFDTKGKSYYQDRIIYLTTNTKKKSHKIRIKVEVVPGE